MALSLLGSEMSPYVFLTRHNPTVQVELDHPKPPKGPSLVSLEEASQFQDMAACNEDSLSYGKRWENL